MMKIKNDFDFKSTITCGQIFRYDIIGKSYIIVLKDRVISIEEDNEYLVIESNNEDNLKSVIEDYFDLKRDYDSIINTLVLNDSKLKDALIYSKGLKMIHQDCFETLIAYIISQNNRVSSIRNSLNLIASNYGEEVIFKNRKYYLFPKLEDLKDVSIEDFRKCKVGFRDKYLYEIIDSLKLKKLDLNLINSLNSNDALSYLMTFKGIGNKVASCILLFAYQKFDVYPIDTWVKKIMLENYKIKGEDNIKKYASDTYSKYSGLAIQYMFNYSRNKR